MTIKFEEFKAHSDNVEKAWENANVVELCKIDDINQLEHCDEIALDYLFDSK